MACAGHIMGLTANGFSGRICRSFFQWAGARGVSPAGLLGEQDKRCGHRSMCMEVHLHWWAELASNRTCVSRRAQGKHYVLSWPRLVLPESSYTPAPLLPWYCRIASVSRNFNASAGAGYSPAAGEIQAQRGPASRTAANSHVKA